MDLPPPNTTMIVTTNVPTAARNRITCTVATDDEHVTFTYRRGDRPAHLEVSYRRDDPMLAIELSRLVEVGA